MFNKKIGPCCEFKDDAELQTYLQEWQERLFLNDWVIQAKLRDGTEMIKDNGSLAGNTNFAFTLKSAFITIAIANDDIRQRIAKYCAEQTLVHELLHLKYNWIEPSQSYESKYIDDMEHQLLDQMAKSLIMAKYDLPFSWFKNF